VNPDRLVAVEVEGQREIPHPLRQADDVLAVADRLIQEVWRHGDEERDDEDAVDGVHAEISSKCNMFG